jgi:uncharacterized ion transporter superfamily protein YfcC
MVFADSLNSTGTIYQIISGMTSNTTGSDTLTVMLILILLILIGIILRMNIELIALIMTPLILVLMAYDTVYTPIGVIFLVFIGYILAKNIIASRY